MTKKKDKIVNKIVKPEDTDLPLPGPELIKNMTPSQKAEFDAFMGGIATTENPVDVTTKDVFDKAKTKNLDTNITDKDIFERVNAELDAKGVDSGWISKDLHSLIKRVKRR